MVGFTSFYFQLSFNNNAVYLCIFHYRWWCGVVLLLELGAAGGIQSKIISMKIKTLLTDDKNVFL